MKCLICSHEGNEIFSGKILNKYEVCYYQCPKCGLIYTEKPYWIEEAYDSSITIYDTGIMSRNISGSIATHTILKILFNNKSITGLDWGGGYGIFVRLMRDLGYRFEWFDKYSENLVSRGFEADMKADKTYDIMTAFEVFEHLPDPLQELGNMLSKSDTLLFSTLLYDDEYSYPKLDEWWYYVPEEGQHIVFYSKVTLKRIAQKFDIHYYPINDSLHIFSKKEIDIKHIRHMVNTRPGSVMSLLRWEWARNRSGSAMKDMETLLKKQNKFGNVKK